ncbi:MAG: diguanylate cyclase [Dehalococcoidia bacterium]
MFKRRDRDQESQDTPSLPEGAAVLRDELGIFPLWYLEMRLREELARAARTNGIFSLACWHLKLLPGERPSDDLLKQAADFIMESLRTYDILARIDEYRFAALLLDAQYEAASTVAFRIKGDLQVRVHSAGRWQAGVAAFPRDAVDADGLIQASIRRLGDDARAA